MELSRQQVITYRVAAQGLLRDGASADELAVLDIGVQDTSGSAALSLDARLRKPEPVPGSLALAWTMRGAPHLHRRHDLDRFAAALFPLSDADALARVDASASMRKAGIAGLDGFRTALKALRTIVTMPTGKGAASTALTKATPGGMHRYCRSCQATHVFEMVLRLPTLAAGIELEPDTAPPVLVPRADALQPDEPDVAALQAVVRAYLTLLGPGTISDAADYFGVRGADLGPVWPDDLVEVGVEGRRGWLPAEAASSIRRRRKTRLTRLLGAYDPYLQARDRDLIVPDAAVRKTLWPILGRPGVLFVDGEVVGIWRPKSAKSRLHLAVEPFAPLPPGVRRDVEHEAERVAAARGAADVEVGWSE
jgi:Winged helix DNA-binding domain